MQNDSNKQQLVGGDWLDLSRFDAAPITHLSYLSFEGQGAFPAEG